MNTFEINQSTTLDKCVWSTKFETFLYKFFGYITACPVSILQSSYGLKIKVKNSILKWMNITIVLLFCYIFVMESMRFALFPKYTTFDILSEITNVTLPYFTSLVILIETHFTLVHFQELLFLKQKTEENLQKLCNREQFECEKYSSIKLYMIILFGYHIFTLILEAITEPISVNLALFYSLWLLLPRTLNRCRYFQHCLFTSTLHLYIKLLRNKIEECTNNIEQNETADSQDDLQQFVLESKRISSDLNLAMEIFSSVSRMAYSVNKTFGTSLFLLFVQDLIMFLSHIVWMLNSINLNKNEDALGEYNFP